MRTWEIQQEQTEETEKEVLLSVFSVGSCSILTLCEMTAMAAVGFRRPKVTGLGNQRRGDVRW